MKKLMVVVAAVAMAACANAASLSWKYNTVAAEKGYTVYLVAGSTAITSMDSVSAFIAAMGSDLVDTQAVQEKGMGTKSYYAQGNVTQNANLPKEADYYFVMIDGTAATAKNFYTSSIYHGDMIYDTDLKEVKPGTTTFDTWAKGPTAIGAVPEPTSAMLLLLGVAGLALRRKQK